VTVPIACSYAGHTPEQVLEYVTNRVTAKDRSRVEIVRTDKRQTSSQISPSDGPHFRTIARAIRESMGNPEVGITRPCCAYR
jgi:hypothetical protein